MSTLTFSPVVMNSGTLIVWPVSSRAGFVPPVERSPCSPGSVYSMRSSTEAGTTDARCREVWQHVEERRAANMRLLVADLRGTGELRDDVTDEVAADLVWSMNAASYFLALRRRGLSADDYAALVREVWTRTLLALPGG